MQDVEHNLEAREAKRFMWFLVFVFSGVILLVVFVNPIGINRDAAVFLDITSRVLDGNHLYDDILDNNMPMAHVLHVPALLIARVLGTNPILPFNLFVFVTVLLSTGLSWRFLARWFDADRYSLSCIFLSLAPLLVSIIMLLFDEFGQREHFFIILFLPAMFARLLRWEGQDVNPALMVIVAFMAAIGSNLKPHLLLVPLLIEIYLLLRYRRWRPLIAIESLIFMGFTLLYAAHFLLWSPAMKAGFFDFMVPLTMEYYNIYSHTSFTFLDFVYAYAPNLLLALLAIVWSIYFRYTDKIREVLRLFGVWSGGAFLTLALQGINFPYHLIPLYFASTVLIILMLSDLLARMTTAHRFSTTLPLVLISGCFMIIGLLRAGLIVTQGVGAYHAELYDYLIQEENGSVLVVDTQVLPAYPTVLQSGHGYVGKYVSGFPIVYGLGEFQSRDEVYEDGIPRTAPLIEDYLAGLQTDIETRHPTLIIFREDPCRACPTGLSLYTYLLDMGFIDTVMELGYVLDEQVDPFMIYRRSGP